MSLLLKVVAELIDPVMASFELGPCDMAEQVKEEIRRIRRQGEIRRQHHSSAPDMGSLKTKEYFLARRRNVGSEDIHDETYPIKKGRSVVLFLKSSTARASLFRQAGI
jgi:hypothetical protein